MSEISFRRDAETNFSVPQKRAVLRDARISLAARGFFAFLWDLPRDWRIRSGALERITRTGKTRLRSIFRELREVGALEFEPIRLSAEEAAQKNETANGELVISGDVFPQSALGDTDAVVSSQVDLFVFNAPP